MPDAINVLPFRDLRADAPASDSHRAGAWRLPGFGPDTRIRTTLGDIPAGLLRRGDEVVTPSGVSCAIAWLDRVGVDAEFLAAQPGAQPWVLPADTLGAGQPTSDLVVSGGQVLARSSAGRTPGPVRGVRGARPSAVPAIRYTLFHCRHPICVLAEGVWCEVNELSAMQGRRTA